MDARVGACLNVTFKAPFYVASRNAQPSPMAHLAACGRTGFCVRPRRLELIFTDRRPAHEMTQIENTNFSKKVRRMLGPRPMILFYNSFFESEPDVSYLDAEDRQAFVWDRSLFAEADAVVFHIPDLVFHTLNLVDIADLQKPPGQVWVAWSMESVVNYPILKNPGFMGRV